MKGLLVVPVSYALGCIVGAYYIVRLRSGGDVRASGSGNAGARNVLRSGDRAAAVMTFLWDVAKGAVAVWIAARLTPAAWAPPLAYVSVIAGHVWPAQLQFRGGRGVAPAIGGALVLATRVLDTPWSVAIGAALGLALVLFAHSAAFNRLRHASSATRAPEEII